MIAWSKQPVSLTALNFSLKFPLHIVQKFFSEVLAVLAMNLAESIVFMCPVEGAKFSLNSQHGNISRQRAGFCFISSELTKMKKLKPRQCEFSQHNPKYPAAVINLLCLYRICVVLQNLMTSRKKQSFRCWTFNKM